jgi:hypothetical protein
VRVVVNARSRLRDTDCLKHFDGVLVGLILCVAKMQSSHFHHLSRNLHEWIQRSHRILKDHRNAPAANFAHRAFLKREDIDSVKQDFAGNNSSGRLGYQTNDGEICN